MKQPIYQHYKGDMIGELYQTEDIYYYKIRYKINNRYKLIGQSYVNLFDKALCMDRMIHDMELIDASMLNRLQKY